MISFLMLVGYAIIAVPTGIFTYEVSIIEVPQEGSAK